MEALAMKEAELATARKQHQQRLTEVLAERDWNLSALKTECDALARELTQTAADQARQLEEIAVQRARLEAHQHRTIEAERARWQAQLSEKESLLEWKTRALAELENELATYRARVQAAVQQRDKLAQEKERLVSELRTQAEAMANFHRHLEKLSSPGGSELVR
jgi:chromosome segregation ATPase